MRRRNDVQSSASTVWTSALNTESGLDSVEDQSVVKALVHQIEKTFHGQRRIFGEQPHLDNALTCGQDNDRVGCILRHRSTRTFVQTIRYLRGIRVRRAALLGRFV